MDLEPMAEALEGRMDRATLRLAALELGSALAGESQEKSLTRLDGALHGGGEGTLEPYDEGLRDGVRAVISGVLQALQAAALRQAEEAASAEVALRPLRVQVLDHLKPAQVFRPGQVAKLLGRDAAQVGKELQAMFAEGLLLEQEVGGQEAVDRRGKYYRLSEKGLRQKEKRRRQPERAVFSGPPRHCQSPRRVSVTFHINGRTQRSSQPVRLSSAPSSVFDLNASPAPVLASAEVAGRLLQEE